VLPRLAAGAGAVHSVETFMEEADRGRVHRLVVVLDVDQ